MTIKRLSTTSNPQVSPPFRKGEFVWCIKASKNVDYLGKVIGNTLCIVNNMYKIKGCLWNYKSGWLIQISNGLYMARDFEKIQSHEANND